MVPTPGARRVYGQTHDKGKRLRLSDGVLGVGGFVGGYVGAFRLREDTMETEITDEEFNDLRDRIVKAWEEYNLLQREYAKQTGTEFKWFD